MGIIATLSQGFRSYAFDVLEVAEKRSPALGKFGFVMICKYLYPCGDLNVVEDFRPASDIVESSQISQCP